MTTVRSPADGRGRAFKYDAAGLHSCTIADPNFKPED